MQILWGTTGILYADRTPLRGTNRIQDACYTPHYPRTVQKMYKTTVKYPCSWARKMLVTSYRQKNKENTFSAWCVDSYCLSFDNKHGTVFQTQALVPFSQFFMKFTSYI